MQKEEYVTIKKAELEEVIHNLLHDALAKELPHECWTCKHFDFPLDAKPRNKACLCPEKLVMFKGRCDMWDLQLDPNKRHRRIY